MAHQRIDARAVRPPESELRMSAALRPRLGSVKAFDRAYRAAPPPTDRQPIAALWDAQIEFVLSQSRFYRESIAPRDPSNRPTFDDLPTLPFTTRADLEQDLARHPPFGSYLCTGRDSIARVHRTSGTTGRPLIIALSRADIETTLTCGARCFVAAGVRTDDLVVHCLSYCMWSGGVTDQEALERAGAGVIPYGVGNSSNLIRMIRTVRPTGIHCTPSYLAKLEQRLDDEFHLEPRDLGLRIGLFGGEPGLQDRRFRERIERVWGFRAVDANYGMAEVLSMFGAECEARCGLHFMGSGVLHPELKDPTSDDVLPWNPGVRGELVLTHLRRECQPLLRYRTSDVIKVLGTGHCDCGLASPRFRVVGRVDDMIVIRGVNVFVGAIANAINECLDSLTGEYRVRVSREQPITNCVVRAEARSDRVHPDASAKLSAKLAQALVVRVDVELVPANTLPRSDGKTQRVERVL